MDPLDGYVDLAVQAGLQLASAEDLTVATRPTFARWQSNLDLHRDRVLELLDEQSVRDFEESLRILDGFWGDGTLGYGIMSARKPG